MEKVLSEKFSVPLVLVVVEGGPGTVKTVLEMLQSDCPIMLLRGSGGAADVVASAIEQAGREMAARAEEELKKDLKEGSLGRLPSPIDILIGDESGGAELPPRFQGVSGLIDQIVGVETANRQGGGPRIFSFDVEREGFETEFEDALLQSLIRGPSVRRDAKLTLSISWNNARVFADVLAEASVAVSPRHTPVPGQEGGGEEGGGKEGAAKEGGGRSVANGEEALVQEALVRDLVHALQHAATQVDDSSFDEELVRMLLEHSALQLDHFPFTLLPLENYAVNNNVQWQSRLWKFLPTVGWAWDEPKGERLGMLELLLWVILEGRDRLARLLWQHTEEPIRTALLASQLYSHLSAKEKTARSRMHREAESLKYEDWAVQMLSLCREDVAIELLEDDFGGRWPNSLLELAIRGGSKRFVAHDYCGELIERRWFGHTLSSACALPRSCSAWYVVACVADQLLHGLCPEEGAPPGHLSGSADRTATWHGDGSRRWSRSGTIPMELLSRVPASQTDVFHVPFVKFVLRTLLELLLLSLWSAVLASGFSGSGAPSVLDATLYLWGWALILDEYYQYKTASGSLSEHFESLWNRIDLLKLSSLAWASALHLAAVPLLPAAPHHARLLLYYSRVGLAFGTLPAFTRLCAAMNLNQSYGAVLPRGRHARDRRVRPRV